MALIINPEEAASWSKEETEINIAYLTDRCRWSELDLIEELRGMSDKPEIPVEETVKEIPVEEKPKPKAAAKPRTKQKGA